MRSLRRYFWRLPLHLRVLGIVGFLLPVASLIWMVPVTVTNWSAPAQLPSEVYRVVALGMNLSLLGLASVLVVRVYCLRFREPGDRKTFPLSSWQSQVRLMTLLGALPLCGLVVALILPPVFAVYFLELLIAVVALAVTTVSYRRATREAAALN
ncbi:MAG TPA: hypothetical protein VFW17_21795 [Ktedonobacterales bacterium]|nr:hypothetical protein [Ktedonobacterales bacterium]